MEKYSKYLQSPAWSMINQSCSHIVFMYKKKSLKKTNNALTRAEFYLFDFFLYIKQITSNGRIIIEAISGCCVRRGRMKKKLL